MQDYENILDAFAGTGALGIEAYSRGALHIDFIDKDINTLKINTKLMEKTSYNIYKGDYFKVSEEFIGLTIVAIGTALPEIITSIISVRKNRGRFDYWKYYRFKYF